MDKERVKIIITGVLILVFIFAWGNTLKVIKKRSLTNAVPSMRKEPLNGTNPGVSAIINPLDKQVPSFTRFSEEPRTARQSPPDKGHVQGRCPFSGKTYFCDEEIIGLKLMGIICDKKASLAIINDNIVKVGDKIGVHTVVDIKLDRVILNNGSRNIELILEQ